MRTDRHYLIAALIGFVVIAGMLLLSYDHPSVYAQNAAQQNFGSYPPAYLIVAESTSNATILSTQNNVACWGWINKSTAPFTTSTFTYDVQTADNTANSYDIGIYDSAGNRIAHTGPLAGTTLFAATGIANVAWTAAANLTPGRKYYIALTSSAASPLAKFAGVITPTFISSASACGSSSSATLPATITVPADSWAAATVPAAVLR